MEILEELRRDIVDIFSQKKIIWEGRLSETSFLSRLYNLKKLKSNDIRFPDAEGDIIQHRVNNSDWEEDWIFYDGRFNLLYCEDDVFLRFLCETIHPAVRTDLEETIMLKNHYNSHLKYAGYEIVEKERRGARPSFENKKIKIEKTDKNILSNKRIPTKEEMIVEDCYEEITSRIDTEQLDLNKYTRLYNNFDEKFKVIFSYLHSRLNHLLDFMNYKLKGNKHFNADQSRELIWIIEVLNTFNSSLSKTEYAFRISEIYKIKLEESVSFLDESGGSEIPPNIKNFNIDKYNPIFMKEGRINIKRKNNNVFAEKIMLGEGSYAVVYKFKDTFLNENFALKKIKNNLNEKELMRFKQEFDNMKILNSPYIVKVYSYDEDNSYIMELMDFSLENYMKKKNDTLTLLQRKNMVSQILKAMEYLHSRGILHRDLSYRNILIKEYDDLLVCKISDFGLLKTKESLLTSSNTTVKGSLNDLSGLKLKGFSNYSIQDETYALTQIIYFIMTGKQNFQKKL
ncbi:MAG: protein kinase, partial [Elusimicrobiaceae bacterium]|nr:protein kinase [Elusimicrobiaceae bacterium]